MPELLNVSGIGPEKADRYGAAIIAICRGAENHSAAAVKVQPERRSSSAETSTVQADRQSSTAPRPAPIRPQIEARPATTDPLTPDQQLLDQRLRDWRNSEAERLGLPQFFILGTSTLRNIVLAQPQTLAELRGIQGVSLEKIEKFGAGIVATCTRLIPSLHLPKTTFNPRIPSRARPAQERCCCGSDTPYRHRTQSEQTAVA